MFLVAKQNSLNINMGNFAPMEQVLYYFKISKAFGITLNTSFKKSKFIAYINISTLKTFAVLKNFYRVLNVSQLSCMYATVGKTHLTYQIL